MRSIIDLNKSRGLRQALVSGKTQLVLRTITAIQSSEGLDGPFCAGVFPNSEINLVSEAKKDC
jgi:hypothetical protein